MTWVKLDDLFPEHPKTLKAGPFGKSLLVDSLCYAARYLTDGAVPRRMALRMAREYEDYIDADELIDRMVAVGFWALDGDDYLIADSPLWAIERDRTGLRLGQSEWAAVRSTVFLRDNFTCQYCGATGGALECDHVMPVIRGGGHELTNLVTACRACNRSKGSKTVEEWARG